MPPSGHCLNRSSGPGWLESGRSVLRCNLNVASTPGSARAFFSHGDAGRAQAAYRCASDRERLRPQYAAREYAGDRDRQRHGHPVGEAGTDYALCYLSSKGPASRVRGLHALLSAALAEFGTRRSSFFVVRRAAYCPCGKDETGFRSTIGSSNLNEFPLMLHPN